MKILQVNTEKTWRGGERQTLLTIKGLKLAGLDPHLLCLDGYPLFQKASQKNLPVIGVSSQIQALKTLARRGSEYDLIHAQTGRAQSLAVITSPFHRRKIVYTRRVDFIPRGIVSWLKYKHTNQLAAISPAIKDILQNFLPGREVPVIPSCIDTSRDTMPASDRAQQIRTRHPGKKIVATIAAMVPHKDPLTMLKAVSRLRELAPDRFVFLHFGQGEMEKEVRSWIKEFGLEKDYLLMGFSPEVESFFPVMDAFVMSSQEEGLGSSVLEAFRYEVPVVSTTAGGLGHLVSGRGLSCPPGDHECLAQNINRLLDDPDSARMFVNRAQGYVLAEHSLEKMATDYIRLYQGMLKE
ncbi:glycosyltransferase family 4 protein [Desulfonatronovibrio hydrogenovorans]|uniref:glycosyltransferase family 4 protein n=1 Tax=Desulfonatronovibrio hydrogenovorans TaxID=53245 RepID=UPI00048F0A08|nr:glycosyltransferase family 4 protein [Desulfonatronovibrio hydrogenovorans]